MKLGQTQIQTQRQIMAPVMQQSIEILMLPVADLEQAIEQELEVNPLLEIDESKLNQQKEAAAEALSESISEEFKLLSSSDPFLYHHYDDDSGEETRMKSTESLEDKLLHQLHIDLDDPLKIAIGEMIIGQLNEDGYLTTSIDEIAGSFNLDSTAAVEEVLRLIQSYEPAGIAARNLQECLRVQAASRFNGKAPLVCEIIEHHLEDLGRKRYDLIAKKLKTHLDHVRHCVQLIAGLEPRPARNYRPIIEGNYVQPDLVIQNHVQNPDEYFLEVNERTIPPLRVNQIYRRLLKTKNLSPEEKKFLKEKLQNALAFIKSIRQRGSTIKEIGNYILRQQEDFFKNGHLALKPMGLKDVAAAVGRNESTVSRAISQKYIDTPQGTFPLKYFFSQSVGNDEYGQGGVSNRSIKEEIIGLIIEEDKKSPLSDHDIQELLTRKGMNISRRTVGKYRKQLNILPSHLRKK
ncbi:MAG: RNA polymerase factor sigma-54 [Candidatus Omnitrophota bacterium]